MSPALELTAVSKTFTMHLRGGLRLPVVAGVAFAVRAGEFVVLAGPSGAGKSSILKMIFGSYRCDAGSILVRHGGSATDVAIAEPRRILALRRDVLGYVSQFLRAVPRVAALDVVAEPLVMAGAARSSATQGCGSASPAQHSRAAVAAAAGHVLGRRAAARQHCARLRIRSADSPVG
jgi:alpha-D-ribose 1-methylphosphonate 5-triphosphate synthase subunit PhnL